MSDLCSSPSLTWNIPVSLNLPLRSSVLKNVSVSCISLDRQPLYYGLVETLCMCFVRRPGGKVNTPMGVGVLTEQSPNYQQKWIRGAEHA
jgi:hypothetical protein